MNQTPFNQIPAPAPATQPPARNLADLEDEITELATLQNEDYLLMIADHGTASHVERLVHEGGYYLALDADAGAEMVWGKYG